MGSGSFKGSNGGGAHRGRPYGMMLLLAFGAALIGVMALQKLRERRISTLLLQNKDRELISLHILLQREREHNRELSKKYQEIKEKVHTLRSRRVELDTRALEMQSIISSLKDDQRTMESTLQEKENELKSMRQRETEASRNDPEEISMRETLKQRETEIQDLKHRLQDQFRMQSVSADDPSNVTSNLSSPGSEMQKDELSDNSQKERSKPGSNDGIQNELNSTSRTEGMTGREKPQGEGRSLDKRGENGEVGGEQEHANEHEINGSRGERKLNTGEGRNTFNATNSSVDANGVSTMGDESSNVGTTAVEGKDTLATVEESEMGQKRDTSEGMMKLEVSDKSHENGADSALSGHQGNVHASRKKGKKWRVIARNRRKNRKLIRGAGEWELRGNQRGDQLDRTDKEKSYDVDSKLEALPQDMMQEKENVRNGGEAEYNDKDKVKVEGLERQEDGEGKADKSSENSNGKFVESENPKSDGDQRESAASSNETNRVENKQEAMENTNSSANGGSSISASSDGEASKTVSEDRKGESDEEVRIQGSQEANAEQETIQKETGKAEGIDDKEGVADKLEGKRNAQNGGSEESEAGKSSNQGTANSELEVNDQYKEEKDESEF